MLSLAHELAEQRGKKLEPINEQRIRKSMGRNGVTGITSWSGMVPATYAADSDASTHRRDPEPVCLLLAMPNKPQQRTSAQSGARR